MRNRHHHGAGGNRQTRAATLVLAFLSDRNPGTFREHDNPLPIGQTAFAMRHHAPERMLACLRSIGIMRSSAIAQPKNGIYKISFLNTKTKGRGMFGSRKMVSHADWCFDSTTAGASGKFS